MTLYLHVGAHKTGTTTIQQFAAARRDLLASRGLYYPDFADIGRKSAPGHHAFSHALAGQATTPPFTEEHVESFVRLCEQLGRGGHVLVSAEPMFRHQLGAGGFWEKHARYVRRLRDRLASIGDVVPVICLRRQDTFAASLVQEHIKRTASTRTLAQYAAANTHFMDYEQHVRLFESVFGSSIVLIYEELIAGDGLLRNFFRALGVELTANEATFRIANPSLHPALVLYKLRHNRERLDGEPIGQGPLLQVSEELFPGEKRSLFPDEELDQVFAVHEASNARLAEHLGFPADKPLFPDRGPSPPRYDVLSDEDFHRIDMRLSQVLAERQAKRLPKRPIPRRRKSLWRRLLTRLGFRRRPQ